MKKKGLGLILAGGRSSRLFPVATPKPLLEVGRRSLLEEAIGRLKGLEIRVVANRQISAEISRAFKRKGLKPPKFFIEPEGRDTAAAVGFGLREAESLKPAWVAVLSADQWMPETKEFPKFLKSIEVEVSKYPGSLFVSGSSKNSKPEDSHTQYGWIVPTSPTGELSRRVLRFVEKPPAAYVSEIHKQGGLINCGMFFGNYDTFVRAFAEHYPNVLNKKFKYAHLERQPIDRAIFEKFDHVRVFDFPLRWEDLGTWADWKRCLEPKSTNYVRTKKLKEVYCFGLENLAVIEDGDRLLVMPLSETPRMKTYLESQK